MSTMFGQAKALTLAFALYQTASAVGKAVVQNKCDFPVNVWSVGSEVSPANTLQSDQSFSETFAWDPKTGGRALKITREVNGLFTGQPQTIFAYNLKDGAIWYDLSDVFGDPFAGLKLVVHSADHSCASIVWLQGTPPARSQVKNCQAGDDVTLTLCAR
ncbi:hypothetical protein ED733_001645 [Metarhizium rileyi]|uniref:Blastomyces yeast-phase-specific protein n=1 Tax=Metarhizium rileyi (strain RCEF 4871) TaxID=1649241 RepID=A0A5C6GCH6_METRR|nr:hypothetical protein ED733_001645 [Metarhizium rileyi]